MPSRSKMSRAPPLRRTRLSGSRWPGAQATISARVTSWPIRLRNRAAMALLAASLLLSTYMIVSCLLSVLSSHHDRCCFQFCQQSPGVCDSLAHRAPLPSPVQLPPILQGSGAGLDRGDQERDASAPEGDHQADSAGAVPVCAQAAGEAVQAAPAGVVLGVPAAVGRA